VVGGGAIAVPVARSLSRSGVEVIALGYRTDPVRYSRHCDTFVDLGAYAGVQERWLEWLRWARPGIVLPCSDDALELVARHREEIEGRGHRAIEADDAILLAMLDKHRTYEMARAAGVDAPATTLVRPGDDVLAATAHIPFPLGIKPRHAHLWQRHFGLGNKVIAVPDRAALEREWARIEPLGLEVLLTEIIPGPDDAYHSYYSYVDEHGKPLAEVTKHKLRQYPPGFGLATFHRIDRHDEAIALGRRLYAEIGLRGLGCVEFKRDARDGRLKIIEVNHRFTLGHEIVRHAGVDYALLAYDRLAGRTPRPYTGYRTGVTMWHPLEDLQVLRSRRRAGTLTVSEWVDSLREAPLHFPLFDRQDPGPSLRSWSRKVTSRAGAAGSVARRASSSLGRAPGSGSAGPGGR
jgi:predicted ATP-grasp superfamily ATP-dependent carboligase